MFGPSRSNSGLEIRNPIEVGVRNNSHRVCSSKIYLSANDIFLELVESRRFEKTIINLQFQYIVITIGPRTVNLTTKIAKYLAFKKTLAECWTKLCWMSEVRAEQTSASIVELEISSKVSINYLVAFACKHRLRCSRECALQRTRIEYWL